MNLTSPIPCFLVIVHKDGTIKTADTVFSESRLASYVENAKASGFQVWYKAVNDVVRECESFPSMISALSQIGSLNGNLPLGFLDGKCGPNDSVSRGIKARAAIEIARHALSLSK
jgi:hypothetical protein